MKKISAKELRKEVVDNIEKCENFTNVFEMIFEYKYSEFMKFKAKHYQEGEFTDENGVIVLATGYYLGVTLRIFSRSNTKTQPYTEYNKNQPIVFNIFLDDRNKNSEHFQSLEQPNMEQILSNNIKKSDLMKYEVDNEAPAPQNVDKLEKIEVEKKNSEEDLAIHKLQMPKLQIHKFTKMVKDTSEEIKMEKKDFEEDLTIPKFATEMVRETVELNPEEDIAIPGKKEENFPIQNDHNEDDLMRYEEDKEAPAPQNVDKLEEIEVEKKNSEEDLAIPKLQIPELQIHKFTKMVKDTSKEIKMEKKDFEEDLTIPKFATEMVRETVELNSEEDIAIPGKKDENFPYQNDRNEISYTHDDREIISGKKDENFPCQINAMKQLPNQTKDRNEISNTYNDKKKINEKKDINLSVQIDQTKINNVYNDRERISGKLKRSQIKMKIKDLRIIAKSKSMKLTRKLMKFKKINDTKINKEDENEKEGGKVTSKLPISRNVKDQNINGKKDKNSPKNGC